MKKNSSIRRRRKKNIFLPILIIITLVMGIVAIGLTFRLAYGHTRLQKYKTNIEKEESYQSNLKSELEQLEQEVKSAKDNINHLNSEISFYQPIVIPDSMKK